MNGADINRYFPRLLHYITIPVRKNAPLLQPPTTNKRWPVMIFSHGLGGSRNAYSHLVGSIASHGVIVIAPEHRDGSTPISFIRDVETTSEKPSVRKAKRTTDYVRLSHTPGPEVEAGRNVQLKIRLWEMGLIHDSILKLDQGHQLTNLNTSSKSLSPFKGLMDVHTPGKITFAGHSFGAATVTQLVKSTFYAPESVYAPKSFEPLFTPSSNSSLTQQITPKTPVILLDVWCLPLRAASTRWLWNKPFPCYTQGGNGGSSLLAVESQAFYKWRVHLKATKRLLSPDPMASKYDYKGKSEPNFFYAATSAHLSQSDFGMLFPWVARRFLAVEDPERIMRLNVRAIVQVLRNCGVEVGKTSRKDMELEGGGEETADDNLVLGRKQDIRGWSWISTDLEDLGDVDDEGEAKGEMVEGQADAMPSVGDELVKQKSGTAERL
jgi:platelet-activating factor acetylhydrolase